ncbi:MAG: RHS repeat domain-containing protein [Nitrospira sp.]
MTRSTPREAPCDRPTRHHHGYDAASQFTTITKGTQTVTLAYDDAGRRTSLTYPNGVVSSYGYDNANGCYQSTM